MPRPRAAAPVALAAALGLALAGPAAAQEPAPAPAPGTSNDEAVTAAPSEVGENGGEPTSVEGDPRPLLAADPRDRWAVASALTGAVEPSWSEKRGGYRSGGGLLRTRLNAEMLIVHALAAVHDQRGAARRDDRVEPLVRHMTDSFFVTRKPKPPPGSKFIHAPGWVQGQRMQLQDKSVDAVAAQSLAAAWRARDVVGLSAETRERMRLRMRQVVTASMWRWPRHVLNQINFSADVWDAHATVTGNDALVRGDYRKALRWFARYARRRGAYRYGTTLLNSGYGFVYGPHRSPRVPINRTDDAEYASMTLGVLRYYDRSVRRGMAPLPARERRTLARWATRVHGGSWMPNGYLNWDNGLGVYRLHLRQYWTLAVRGLGNGLAGSRGLPVPATMVGEARSNLDASVRLYQRFALEEGNALLAPTSFGLKSPFVAQRQDRGLAAARFAAGMAEAADDAGIDRFTRRAPRARVASDHDIGRVSVGTRRYGTAFVPPNAKLRTGGLEPARLHDRTAEPVTALGGWGDGTLGVRVLLGGRTLVDTQPGIGPGAGSVSRIRVPGGRRNRTTLLGGGVTVRGSARRGGAGVNVAHRLTGASIASRYAVRPGGGGRELVLRLPSFGRGTEVRQVVAGADRPVGARVGSSATFRLQRPGGHGYVVRVSGLRGGARTRLHTPNARSTNPRPGVQLSLRVRVPRDGLRVERAIRVLPVG